MKIIEKSAKTIDDAVNEVIKETGASREQMEIEVVNEGRRGLLGIGSELAVIRVKIKENTFEKGKDYLQNILDKTDIEFEIEGKYEDETVFLEIKGNSDDMGKLIGRRGETLDALQYLTSLVVNKEEEEYIRVNIDTENYRKKREETLKKLAKRMAAVASKSHKNITLEPMNPNERRIIHSALQEYNNITTYSVGQEPKRCIVITTKKKEYGRDYVSKYRYNRKENEIKTE